jgi:effector-binding domain-containing protein
MKSAISAVCWATLGRWIARASDISSSRQRLSTPPLSRNETGWSNRPRGHPAAVVDPPTGVLLCSKGFHGEDTMEYKFEVVDLSPQPVLVIEAEVAPPDLGAALGRIFPTVHAHIAAQGGDMAGMPFLRYLNMTDRFSIQAGIPVAKPVTGTDEILATELPGGRTATTLFLGPYDQVGLAWDALREWCADQQIETAFGGWDVYENDPTTVNSPQEIRTRIYQPLG